MTIAEIEALARRGESDSRTPDIPSGEMSGFRSWEMEPPPGAGLGRAPGMQSSLWPRADGEAHRETGSREDGGCLGECLAERLHSQSAVRGAEWTDRDTKSGIGDVDVAAAWKSSCNSVRPWSSLRA